MVKDIRFDCDDARIDTSYHNRKIGVEASKVDVEDILNQLEPLEVTEAFNEKDQLLECLLEWVDNDEILHDYLEKSGYIFNKA